MDQLLLVAQAKKVQRLGFPPVPIIAGEDKKPPSWFAWTDLRDGRRSALTDEEIEDIFSNPEVGRVGILLNRRSLLIDYDGMLGHSVLWSELMPRCSPELQRQLRATAHTKTPHGGHILVLLDANAFPDGIEEMLCWQLIANGHGGNGNGNNGHAEIRVLSQNKYSVEYGQDYEPIVDIQQVVTLSKEASIELVEICRHFKSESIVVRNIASSILPYWVKERRQDLALAIPGYLYKNKVTIDVARHLIQYITQVTGDEEAVKRLEAVNSTYSKDAKEVSGYTRLIELIDENESIIQKIAQQFGKIGYDFYNGNGRAHTDTASSNNSNAKDNKKPDESVVLLEELHQRRELNALFVDKHGTPFSAIMINDHREVLAIKSSRFRKWICKRYFETHAEPIKTEILKQFCDLLEAQALFSNDVKDLQLRTANENYGQGTIYLSSTYNKTICYDLTNKEWQVVRASPNGWKVEQSTDVSIMFRRHSNQIPQVIPSKSYPADIFDMFMDLINVKDDSNKLLLKCYIIALFIPDIPKPVLMLHGEQGSAKSTLQELTKMLVDPSSIINLTFPRDTNELIQQLSHNYIAYYDNVSIIRDWVSDQICRAVTGSGFSKRELYSDDDDIIYNFKRCLGFNGVNLAAIKADLLDRGIIIQLEHIAKEKRRKIVDIISELESIKQALLGYIFDIIVKVLRVVANGGIELDSKSRMADFEEYAEIISRCMGYGDNEFIKAYRENQKLQTEAVIEGSPVVLAIMRFAQSLTRKWNGTATELLAALDPIAVELKINIKGKSWPKGAHVLSRKLNEFKTNLRATGICIEHVKSASGGARIIEIRKVASEASVASDGSKSRSNNPNPSDATESDDKVASEVASDRNGQNRAQNQVSDATDASDGIIHTCLGAYSCPYCESRFTTSDLYLRHVVKSHAGWTAYPGPPDLEKYRRLQNDKRSKLADIAKTNESGNGIMPSYGGEGGNGQGKEI